MQQLVVAFLVFGIGDRVLGPEWSVTAESWVKESFWGTIPLENPMLWLLFGLVIWAVIFLVTYRGGNGGGVIVVMMLERSC